MKNNNRSNLQKGNFARAAHFFFVNLFAVVLHDYNVKLPETFLVTRFLEEMSYVLIIIIIIIIVGFYGPFKEFSMRLQ